MRLLFLLCATACGRIGFEATQDGGLQDGCVVSVGLGLAHTCATLRSGETYCVGDNAQGQLGIGMVSGAITTPVLARELPAAIEVKGGRAFTAIRDAAGGVACLGDNGNRNCGRFTGNATLLVAIAPAIPPATMIALGNTFGCAATGGQVWCWGDNDEAEAGNNTNTSHHDPEVVSLAANATLSLAAGDNHACVVTDGGVMQCWGDGRTLRLGSVVTDACPNATDGAIVCSLLPVTVPIAAARSVIAGQAHTCAVLQTNEPWCWGENDQGQVGRPVSLEEPPSLVSGIGQVSAIAAGRNHTCAIDTSGIVSCWGDNSMGQLGSSIGDSSTPVVVPLPASASAIAAHALGFHTCARLVDDSVWCWGANDFGQLGRGVTSPSEAPGPLDVPCL